MFVIFLVGLFAWATWRLLKTNAIRTWLKQTCNQKDVVGIAKEYGLDFTADKISQLSEEELECVSAGTFLYTQMLSNLATQDCPEHVRADRTSEGPLQEIMVTLAKPLHDLGLSFFSHTQELTNLPPIPCTIDRNIDQSKTLLNILAITGGEI